MEWFIASLFVITFQAVTGADVASPEKMLIDTLMTNYSPSARPVRDPSAAVEVNLTFILFSMDAIDEKRQTITLKGILRMKWNDAFLTWNKTTHFGMERIILEQELVWRPDIVVYNGVGSINTPIQTEQNKVIVNNDGAIEWDAEGTFHVSCPVKMARFPFDEQSCSIKISNNKYTLREVHPTLQNYSTSGVAFNNGQWKILKLDVNNKLDGKGYKYMGFHIRMRRRPNFYVMNMVLPSLVLTVLGNCLYLIPPQTSDRVALGTTLVLAYTVFMIQVTERIPGSFRYIPYITVFLVVAMVMSALVVVISILVLRLSRPILFGTTARLTPKEKMGLELKQASRAKLVHRVDMTFFFVHLTVFLGLCSSAVFFALE